MKKPNHQPFEAWLFSEELLTDEQAQALQSHLVICSSCRQLSEAWSDVERRFRRETLLAPVAGFAARWHARLAARQLQEQLQKQQQQSWWTLILCIAGAAGLLGALATNILSSSSPTALLFVLAHQVSVIVSFADVLQEILATLGRVLWALIPLNWWAMLAPGLALLSLLWIVSIRKILLPMEVRS